MKTAALFLCIFAITAGIACAQTWDVQSPLPTETALTAVCFRDSLHGWIGGASAIILGTDDGGQTWTEQYLTSSPLNEITGISFPDEQNGWAVAATDLLLHTTNGGAFWAPETTGFLTGGGSIHFTSAQNGWIVGSSIVHTTDGGTLWEEVIIWSPNEFETACFLDSLHGWLGQNENVFRTTNGGASWIRYESVLIQTRALAFRDTVNGWMLGSIANEQEDPDSFKVYQTTNAGQTWTLRANHLTGLSGVVLGADGRVIVYGQTTMMTSTDNGQTWQTYPSPAHIYLSAMSPAGNRFCAVSRNALIAFTADGDQWDYSGSGVNLPITNIRMADDLHGWAGGTLLQESAAILLRTTDGGTHWRPCDGAPKTGAVSDLACTDTNHVWAAVTDYTHGNILHSGDGGVTWSLQMADSTPSMTGVYFMDSQTGWAVGNAGIYHSTNGGQAWAMQHASEPLEMITFIDALHGWAAGTSQNIYRTSNGGSVWQSFASGVFDGFADMQFTDSTHGIAATTNGLVKRTTNGGQNWTTVTGNNWDAVQRVDFADNLHGWLSGYTRITYAPAIWATYNGGATWLHLTDAPLTGGLMDDICLGDDFDGWAVGARQILRYRGVDAAPLENAAAASQFSLSVYPNPFNARAMLTFDVTTAGRVSLTVFDVLGREVEKVSDRFMMPGQYTISYDAAHLSSGIYFVRLSTPALTETQKIVLMK